MKSFLLISEQYITDFINTQFTPHGDIIENFENFSDVKDWFLKVGLFDENELNNINDNESYFKELIDYRTLIKTSFEAYIKSGISLDKLIKTTNNILLKAKVHPQILNNNNSFILEYLASSNIHNELLTKIAIEVVKLLSSKEFKYLKKCDNHKCSLFFIDTSKNHSRRWCSMEICGNRSKASNFVKRKKDLIK